MSLYALLLLASILVPLVLSFDKKLQFYRKWHVLIPVLFLVALVYVLPDIYLTHQGVWGFNARYHSALLLWGLPLEECLFFIIIPYASLFIHYSLFAYLPAWHLSAPKGKILTAALMVAAAVLLFQHPEKRYTAYILSILLLLLGLSFLDKNRLIDKFYSSYLLIMLPFLVVNGILTGSLIEGEVVWYSQADILGLRIFTIPIEDVAYGFTLILLNLYLLEWGLRILPAWGIASWRKRLKPTKV